MDSHSYQRDAVGDVTQETITGSVNSTSTFGYDDLYRLTSATVAGTAYSWVYDPVGNRTSQTVGGVTTTYTVDGADHLTAVNGVAVSSDANGSVLQDETGGTYTWDVRGRLVGLNKGGKSYAFQYGPDGLRLNKSVGGVLTTYLLDGEQVVTDTIGGVANQTLYGPGTDHALARNGEFFLPNSLGSTSLLADSGGNAKQSYQYSPFGALLNSPTDSNPFQFTGRENDGSGLLYYRARYYNPGWGRFVSADPSGFGGGINPYVYALNNPVNFGDASGTQTGWNPYTNANDLGSGPGSTAFAEQHPTIDGISAALGGAESFGTVGAPASSGAPAAGTGEGGGGESGEGGGDGAPGAPAASGSPSGGDTGGAPGDSNWVDSPQNNYGGPPGTHVVDVGSGGSGTNLPVPYYPPNNGFEGPPFVIELPPGTVIWRYGDPYGRFVTDPGTLPGQVSLPYGPIPAPTAYVVTGPIPFVQAGPASPWFNQPGGGMQYRLPFPIQYYLGGGRMSPQ